MNAYFKKAANDKIIKYGNGFSFFFLIIGLLYTLLVYRSLPPYLPVFNQMPWGELRLGERPLIFLPLALAWGISLVNTFFSSQLYDEMPLLSRMVTITTLLISIITFIFLFRVTRLVL